ncbi:MAG: hypothetical protein KGI87_07405 [Burkholderiales bacterium]|nr:hypothetical protein [Burkholderiales bacterium]
MNNSDSARSTPTAAGAPAPDAWQATRAQTSLATQMLKDEDEYLAPEKHDIGRQTGVNERELFVSCDPALAMQQQFEHLHPEFIAVHDIATASSRRLLAGIAAAGGRAVQKLVIRRQGYGTALASLEFVELPAADGGVLRMYSTEVDADTVARHGLSRMLLAFSRLGVIMVGDLPAHSIASALKPFQEFMLSGPWPNRQLLLLPLASGNALAAQGAELARGTGVNVRTTPQVTRPADAWGFINGTWARLGELGPTDVRRAAMPAGAAGSSATAPSRPMDVVGKPSAVAGARAATDPLTMRPMPSVSSAAARAAAPRSLLDRYVQQLAELPGMVSCCVFDVASGLEVTHAGASPGAADLAMHGKALLAGMSASSRSLGLGHTLPEAAITLGSHHLLLRAVPGHPGLALHAALDKASANLTLARLQVQRMDTLFGPPART